MQRMKREAIRTFRLPPDVVLDMPRITVVGPIHVTVENHRGLSLFTAEEVRLLAAVGQIVVRGEGLVIRALSKDEIFIEGHVKGIVYIDMPS
ncbi:MAG: sporulation protein YqfC [Candidatus Carbobacillus altaicus]|nr:sporulation protein YqfC [Candidatus Carbobacillus altaicus]